MKPTTLGFVVPGVAKEYGLKSPVNPTGHPATALLPLAGIAGTVIGSFTWGWLGDRIGRRASILLAGVLFVGTAICGTMPSYQLNLVMCFVMGLGVGAVSFCGGRCAGTRDRLTRARARCLEDPPSSSPTDAVRTVGQPREVVEDADDVGHFEAALVVEPDLMQGCPIVGADRVGVGTQLLRERAEFALARRERCVGPVPVLDRGRRLVIAPP